MASDPARIRNLNFNTYYSATNYLYTSVIDLVVDVVSDVMLRLRWTLQSGLNYQSL
jgi:hypothetical protein